MYSLIRNALFRLPPEISHELSLTSIDAANSFKLSGVLKPCIKSKPIELLGMSFPHAVGLAAGLDKNGDHIDGLAALGFAFLEIGTVTPRPQPGNPKPRLFRLPKQQAIINRMGFNNKGIEHLVEQVTKSRYKGILGINIGKNFDTPVEKAEEDYLICLRKAYDHASYITVNISSPNTPGLRDLQFGQQLASLLERLKQEQKVLAQQYGKYIPLLVKIAPDMQEQDTQQIADVLREQNIDGVIATNTTIGREGVEGLKHSDEAGGLSGLPVGDKSTQTIHCLSQALQGELPIIGVGGIVDANSAVAKIEAGASLVQVYTGFIYQGPKLIGQAANAIAKA